MRLRSLLGLFALGMVFLPLSLAPMAGLIFGSHGSNSSPLSHSLVVMRVVRQSIRVVDEQYLALRDNPRVPDWMQLVITDAAGIAILSTFPEISPGSRIDGSIIPSPGNSILSGNRFVADTITIRGNIAGAYAARFPSQGYSLSIDPAWPFFAASMLLILAIVAFAASGIISARLVRAFRNLEKAAERIARGDLGTAVTAHGIREISALASAMESMRGSLREAFSRRARFLAGVSHDLRTPLTSIRGYLEAVEDGLAEDPETLKRYLSIMEEKTGLLEDRITELLDFARMETGEWRLRLSDLELAPFLRRIAAGYTEDAAAQKRSFSHSVDGVEDLVLRADEKMLSRALENIFTNALRYAPPGSRIELSTRREAETVLVEIADDGPGIPPAELSLIFEPWFRGKTSSGEQSGLGLGLSIARSIITDHGWSLTACSAPGSGSRFSLRIPRNPENG